MTCVNARDTITQDAGFALANHFDYPDNAHTITSFCRTADGTWATWINEIPGDDLDLEIGDTDKANWPASIASAYAISVGFFPDDGSAPVVYDLGIDPIYNWHQIVSRTVLVCDYWFVVGDVFSDWGFVELRGWSMNPIDVQVRTDGTNVWVVVLAQEAVEYPFLYLPAGVPGRDDRCGVRHPSMGDLWPGFSDPFALDGTHWWLYGRGFIVGGDMFMGPYDDAGQDKAFRWEPARVTVFAGDVGGFTKIDTIEAKFDNMRSSSSLLSGIEAAASTAEPGVLHVLWSEGGDFGTNGIADQRGQRINYSRWSSSAKTLDTDLLYETVDGYGSEAEAEGQPGGAFMPPDQFVFTGEIILRNDHGAPIAIIWPWIADEGGPLYPDSRAQFWDLNLGEVIQTLDPGLVPTPAETGSSFLQLEGTLGQAPTHPPRRFQYASSLYADPLLGGRHVYLVCAHYIDGGLARTRIAALYRIPCDGADTFDFMDGIRAANYSIVPDPSRLTFADFVSDPDNIWIPSAGPNVMHFTRRCIPTWDFLAGFPLDGNEYDWSVFTIATSPPSIVTDVAGDWLAGAGNAPIAAQREGEGIDMAALRAKICRCCIPCAPLVIRTWQKLS